MKIRKFSGIKYIDGGICAPKGFKAGGIQCGLAHKPLSEFKGNVPAENNKKKNDLALIVADVLCNTAAVYTQNKVKGAPIVITKKHLADGVAKAVIVNSVNANTCNADGEEKALRMCELVSEKLGIPVCDVAVASTGVIGQPLPIEPIEKGMAELVKSISYNGNDEALEAIMTTDTMKKEIAVEFELGGKTCHIGAMLKGSGMIHPNMATTLTFVTTDAAIKTEYLQRILSEVVKVTLNRVSVDGDMSTNDMVCVMASGLAENPEIGSENTDYEKFRNALYAVLVNLARMMARDGEGATKLVECVCSGAGSEMMAETVSKSVITSSLFKAMIFGEDANCGRILCAVGYADADFDISKVSVWIVSEAGKIAVCKNGIVLDFSEEEASEILAQEEITVLVDLGEGTHNAVAWGCDLTYDYVKINGDYRS